MSSSLTPQQRAEKSAEVMFSHDRASKLLDMTIDAIGPGMAVMSMTVRDDMLNGAAVCHGGYIFSLADSCFAFACNSYNQKFLAHHCTISYLSPGRKGARLTATAKEIQKKGRSGIYDVVVRDESNGGGENGEGETIALFRGICRAFEGPLFEE